MPQVFFPWRSLARRHPRCWCHLDAFDSTLHNDDTGIYSFDLGLLATISPLSNDMHPFLHPNLVQFSFILTPNFRTCCNKYCVVLLRQSLMPHYFMFSACSPRFSAYLSPGGRPGAHSLFLVNDCKRACSRRVARDWAPTSQLSFVPPGVILAAAARLSGMRLSRAGAWTITTYKLDFARSNINNIAVIKGQFTLSIAGGAHHPAILLYPSGGPDDLARVSRPRP